ncbi:MAG: PDZ domain-containing protein [Tepidisphaeraceae bacterium]|jgi:S1-C subfamily serine protease
MTHSRGLRFLAICIGAIWIAAAPLASAQNVNPTGVLREKVKPSLVAVKYTWANELQSRELVAAGIVVGDDGLVMFPLTMVTPLLIPDDQMKDFKIVIPSDTLDETEIDAVLVLRDERTGLAFVRPDPNSTSNAAVQWKPIQFVDALPQVGDPLYSVGLLPKTSGYRAFVTSAAMSAPLRGPVPQELVDGDLAGVGSPVFDAKGDAIGYVPMQGNQGPLLDNPEQPDDLPMVYSPAKMFVPASDFLWSLSPEPSADKPLVIPWIGCMELNGLDKELAEFVGLTNVPAVQIGDVVPNSPADRAGLKTKDIIIKMNGQPLERGDVPAEVQEILARKIMKMKVGDIVTLTVIHDRGDVPRDVTVTLEERPKQPHSARRFYAKDLGFVVREVVFIDTYHRKLPPSAEGVVIAMLRPQGPAAAAKLEINDMVTNMNGNPVTDIDEFKKDYQDFRTQNPRGAVVLVVSQLDGREQTINIQPPEEDGLSGGSGGGN